MTRSEDLPGCVFCIARTIGEGRELIVHDGALAYVILNKFPYNAGHLMVVPQRHVATMAGLEDSELSEMAKLDRAQQPELHLRPNKLARYEVVAGVMASVQRFGLTKFGIVGAEQFIE